MDTTKMVEKWRALEAELTSVANALRAAREFATTIADIPESTANELARLQAEVSLWETNLSML